MEAFFGIMCEPQEQNYKYLGSISVMPLAVFLGLALHLESHVVELINPQ